MCDVIISSQDSSPTFSWTQRLLIDLSLSYSLLHLAFLSLALSFSRSPFLQQFGKILDVEIIFNERGSKVWMTLAFFPSVCVCVATISSELFIGLETPVWSSSSQIKDYKVEDMAAHIIRASSGSEVSRSQDFTIICCLFRRHREWRTLALLMLTSGFTIIRVMMTKLPCSFSSRAYCREAGASCHTDKIFWRTAGTLNIEKP